MYFEKTINLFEITNTHKPHKHKQANLIIYGTIIFRQFVNNFKIIIMQNRCFRHL